MLQRSKHSVVVSSNVPVTFITICHSHYDYIMGMLASLTKYWDAPYEVIIVDNLNLDIYKQLPLLDKCKNAEYSIISNKEPKSFGYNNNQAVKQAKYETIFLINPDTELIDDSIYQYVQEEYHPQDLGLIYPQLLNGDGSEQQHYNEWPSLLNQCIRLFHAKCGKPISQYQGRKNWFFGSAIITNKQTFAYLGGFNEWFPLYCEDVDLCHKARLVNIPIHHQTNIKMKHFLGGEAKHKFLYKAVVSNAIWRVVRIQNVIKAKLGLPF